MVWHPNCRAPGEYLVCSYLNTILSLVHFTVGKKKILTRIPIFKDDDDPSMMMIKECLYFLLFGVTTYILFNRWSHFTYVPNI